MKTVIEMAREAGIRSPDFYKLTVGHMLIAQLERLVDLARADEREACLNCYSPDDTATDWADKIRARSNT